MINNKMQNVMITKEAAEVMKCCANTGLVTKQNANKLLGLSLEKLKDLVRCGFLQEKNIIVKGKSVKIFRLTSTAVKWLKAYTSIGNLYRSNPKQILHDIKLSQVYCELPEQLRSTWMSDEQIKATFSDIIVNDRTKHFSTVDALITNEKGKLIAIEVLTENYKKHEIEEKHEMARKIGCEGIFEIR
jgi:hypothetical protein